MTRLARLSNHRDNRRGFADLEKVYIAHGPIDLRYQLADRKDRRCRKQSRGVCISREYYDPRFLTQAHLISGA